MVQKYDVVSVVVPIIGIAYLVLSVWVGWLPMNDIQSAIPYIVITIIIGVFLWGQQRRLENALGKKPTTSSEESTPKYKPDSNFVHLAIHYLRIKGAQDTPDSAQLRYVTNDKNRVAFLVRDLPDWLVAAVKEHKMTWCPYDDEKVLRKTLLAGYSVSDIPPIPETLGLKFIGGNWIEYTPHSELLSTLEGHRLKNLQVLHLTRRYFFSEVRRTLLIKFSEDKAKKSEVWLAPSFVFELVEKGILTEEYKGMRFWESCEKWCKRKGYDTTHIDRHYPESALLAEGS